MRDVTHVHAAEMEELGRRLWGKPNTVHSSRDDVRFGRNGSKSIDRTKATWFDHEANEGGGYIDLYEKVHGTRPGANSSIAATYDYRDADSALLFQVVRKVPKTFRQRRPDGAGGWEWSTKGVRQVLYRLPELLAADPNEPVFVVEGEKDVDNLRATGLVSTCNAGGAGKWRVEIGEPLRGRHVITLCDNDAAGREHAADVRRKLHGIAASVRDIPLPGLPEKGDVSDWLAAGGTAAKLLDMLTVGDDTAAPVAESTDDMVDPAFRALLSIEAWAERDIPQPERLLGDLLTKTSRMFLVGRTGLGKTMLGLGIACGIAAGTGFLHWRSARPARVLYIDGEMPGELIKARCIDALRRAGAPPPPGNLVIYARDMEEEIARQFPTLGTFAPLNTEAGQIFVHALISQISDVDVVIFDNVMSLVAGDQKDEVPWSETLPLVSSLTAAKIGQIWLDHTGHAIDRQYGSATKGWRFDTIGQMAPLPDDQRQPHELAFTLSFEPPGKARRRTPDNWRDFETTTIRLKDDRWTSDAMSDDSTVGAAQPARKEAKLRDQPAILLREVRNMMVDHAEKVCPLPGMPIVAAIPRKLLRGRLILAGWFNETVLRPSDSGEATLQRTGYAHEHHALSTLKRNKLAMFNRDWVWLP